MKRTIATVFYWFAAITITLGAYGHGFVGVKPTAEAIAASQLAPDIVRVVWIVWYFAAGCMVTFGILLFWAWPGLKSGSSSRSAAALVIGTFYLINGIASYLYSQRDPFWLLFVTLGVIVIGSTLVLAGPQGSRSA